MITLLLVGALSFSPPKRDFGFHASEKALRLRGGQTEPPDESPPKNALTREEITEKMNAIPVFCVVNDKGGLVGTRFVDGKEAICWFTDAAESKVRTPCAGPHSCNP